MSKLKKSIHESVVEDSFEELKHLSAVAGDEAEDLDTDEEDVDEEEDEDSDSDEEGDVDEEETVEDDDEDSEDEDSEDEDSEDEDSEDEDGEESDSDEDETFEEVEESDDEEDNEDDVDVDEDSEEESDSDEDETYEEEETDDEDGEESDSDEDEVNEDEILAALQEDGLIAIITTADQVSESDFAVAVAGIEADDDEDDSETDDEDEEEDDAEDEDSEEESDSDDDDEDDVTEDEEEDDESAEADSDDEDEEDEESDSDDEEEPVEDDESDEDAEADSDEDEIDADRLAPVASMEFLASASVSDVDMVFYNHRSNPVWNVIVAGVPAASISLASYGDAAQEVADFFSTTKFANGVKQAMASEGVLGLLKKSNAEFYANAYKSSDVFVEARAAAEKVGNQKVTAATAGLREDFIDAMKIASAGMDKNFFQKKNPLKRGLFIALSNAGVQNPQFLIETVFAESSAEYFETVADVAVDFLDTPAEARDRLRQAIEGSGVIDRGIAQASSNEPKTVADPSASALALIRGMRIQASSAELPMVTGSVSERKDSLRTLLR